MKKMFMPFFILIFILGCAKRPESISASYVSHEKFIDNNCLELKDKMDESKKELTLLSEKQNGKANADAVGVFLLGISFSQLSGDYESEIARYKGQVEAIETAQIKNKCIVN